MKLFVYENVTDNESEFSHMMLDNILKELDLAKYSALKVMP